MLITEYVGYDSVGCRTQSVSSLVRTCLRLLSIRCRNVTE